LQPCKLPLRFHFQNTVAEKAVLCQQVKEIAHQHTEGAAGDDVGGIIGGGGALLFPDFCVVLFQHGGQGRELRRFQLGKVLPVPKYQIAAGDTPGGKLFLRDLSVALCRFGQIFQILFVLRLSRQEGELVEQAVQMHLIIDMVFVGLTVNRIFHILFHPFLIRFPHHGKPRWALS